MMRKRKLPIHVIALCDTKRVISYVTGRYNCSTLRCVPRFQRLATRNLEAGSLMKGIVVAPSIVPRTAKPPARSGSSFSRYQGLLLG